jgi:hypothetical protein
MARSSEFSSGLIPPDEANWDSHRADAPVTDAAAQTAAQYASNPYAALGNKDLVNQFYAQEAAKPKSTAEKVGGEIVKAATVGLAQPFIRAGMQTAAGLATTATGAVGAPKPEWTTKPQDIAGINVYKPTYGLKDVGYDAAQILTDVLGGEILSATGKATKAAAKATTAATTTAAKKVAPVTAAKVGTAVSKVTEPVKATAAGVAAATKAVKTSTFDAALAPSKTGGVTQAGDIISPTKTSEFIKGQYAEAKRMSKDAVAPGETSVVQPKPAPGMKSYVESNVKALNRQTSGQYSPEELAGQLEKAAGAAKEAQGAYEASITKEASKVLGGAPRGAIGTQFAKSTLEKPGPAGESGGGTGRRQSGTPGPKPSGGGGVDTITEPEISATVADLGTPSGADTFIPKGAKSATALAPTIPAVAKIGGGRPDAKYPVGSGAPSSSSLPQGPGMGSQFKPVPQGTGSPAAPAPAPSPITTAPSSTPSTTIGASPAASVTSNAAWRVGERSSTPMTPVVPRQFTETVPKTKETLTYKHDYDTTASPATGPGAAPSPDTGITPKGLPKLGVSVEPTVGVEPKVEIPPAPKPEPKLGPAPEVPTTPPPTPTTEPRPTETAQEEPKTKDAVIGGGAGTTPTDFAKIPYIA